MRRVRHSLEYAGFRLVAAIVRLMPLDAASAVMGRLWRWLAPMTERHARALDHLRLALPEKSDFERRRIADRMWDNLGRVFAETLLLKRLVAEYGTRIEESVEALDAFRDAGRGRLVLVSLHMGNWETCILPATRRGFNPIGVYRQVNNPLIDRYLREERERVFPAGLMSKGHQTAKRLLDHLRSHGSIGIIGDIREPRGVDVRFFGETASATHFPAMLARHCGVPLVVGRCVRTRGANFRIETRLVDYPVSEDRKADVLAATQAVHDVFEDWIRDEPGQWMWTQRKWAVGRNDRRQRIRELSEARKRSEAVEEVRRDEPR